MSIVRASSGCVARAVLGALAWCVAGNGVAEILAQPGGADPRIRVAPYRSDEVYRLLAYVGFQIDLEFEPGEEFAGVGGGDLDGITHGAHANHLVLKPRAVNVGTNLTVFTNRRHYHFEYSASARRPDVMTDEVIYALRFTYPPPDPAVALAAAQIERGLADAEIVRPRNRDYWYCGDPSVKPLAASDDGVHTRLTFAPKAELPALFVRNEDGSESLLNFSMDEGDVIVHRIARQLIVRRGQLVGRIVNKGYTGGGTRLESSTVSPEVERRTKDADP